MIKGRLSLATCLLAVVLCMIFSGSLAYSYSGALANCQRAEPAPTIDGIVMEGEWGEGIYLDKSSTLKGEPDYNGFGNCYTPEHIQDAEDCSGTLYCLWDDSALYLAAKITDDDLFFGGDAMWKNDCTEWRFDVDGVSDSAYIGMWITPEFQGAGAGWQRRNNINGLDVPVEQLPSIETTINADGYEWELRIPATEPILEGIELRAGNVAGFTVSIGEQDKEGAEYSMPCWSLNPDNWGWDEEFWGQIVFSADVLTAVSSDGRLASVWGAIKTR